MIGFWVAGAALAADPCARLEPSADGLVADIGTPTAWDPVGDLVALHVDVGSVTRLRLDFRLAADHPALLTRDRDLELVLADGTVLSVQAEIAALVEVELQNALAPGLIEVDVPIATVLDPASVATLAAQRLGGVRLVADPGHTWVIRAGAARGVTRAARCALQRAP